MYGYRYMYLYLFIYICTQTDSQAGRQAGRHPFAKAPIQIKSDSPVLKGRTKNELRTKRRWCKACSVTRKGTLRVIGN